MADSNIPESVLEEFRCFRCKDFLHTPPIVLLSDGNSLCGICSTSTEETTCRQLVFENFLRTLRFPCKFKRYGCTAHLRFRETQEHEAECIHCPRTCPVSTSCAWEGAIQQMCNHFTTDHSDLMADKIEFKLNVRAKNEPGLLLAHVNGVSGILRYSYSLAFGNLQYNIQHFNTNYEEILVNISITNNLNSDYKVHVKGGVSHLFNDHFYRDLREDSSSKTLSLSSFFPKLNHPDSILVSMDWQIDKSKKVSKRNERAQSIYKSVKPKIVNYALINTLKCDICKGFLLPPLYKKPNYSNWGSFINWDVICWYCHNKYHHEAKPELDQGKLQKLEKVYFLCRWSGCEVSKPGTDLVRHELSCMLRMYSCHDCVENTFTRESIILHAKEHGYDYFKDCHTFDMCFMSDGFKDPNVRRFVTFKNEEYVYITCWIHDSFCKFEQHFEYISEANNIVVEFEHDHCKVKSETFICQPSQSLQVEKGNLPHCFNNDQQIKVTLKV